MAKKIQVKQILELRAAGLSQNIIAKSRHMSKSSVNDVFQIARGLSISYESVKDLRPEEVGYISATNLLIAIVTSIIVPEIIYYLINLSKKCKEVSCDS